MQEVTFPKNVSAVPVEIDVKTTNESMDLQETASFLVEVKATGGDARLSCKSVCLV